jgi:hypothetical protein
MTKDFRAVNLKLGTVSQKLGQAVKDETLRVDSDLPNLAIQ